MLAEGQLILYFHSALRNVGLFTSICVAAITGANAFKHTPGHRVPVGMLSLYAAGFMFLSVSVFINWQMLQDFERSFGEIERARAAAGEGESVSGVDFAAWRALPQWVLGAQALIAAVLVFSLARRGGALWGAGSSGAPV
jgi:hypothetical protein